MTRKVSRRTFVITSFPRFFATVCGYFALSLVLDGLAGIQKTISDLFPLLWKLKPKASLNQQRVIQNEPLWCFGGFYSTCRCQGRTPEQGDIRFLQHRGANCAILFAIGTHLNLKGVQQFSFLTEANRMRKNRVLDRVLNNFEFQLFFDATMRSLKW